MKFTALIRHLTNVIILQRILNFWLLQPFLTSQHNNTTLTLYKSSISSVMRKSSCLNLSKIKFFQPHFLPSSLFSFSNSLIANSSYAYILFYKLLLLSLWILIQLLFLCRSFKTYTSNTLYFSGTDVVIMTKTLKSTEIKERLNSYITTCS